MIKNEEKINKKNKENISTPIIYTPGLNQLYFIDYKYLSYSSFEKEIISLIQNINKSIDFNEELIKILDNYDSNLIINYSEFKTKLFEKTNLDFNKILEHLNEWILKNINYLHKKQLSFIKSINGNIYNENPFHLLIDEIFLTKYKKENYLTLNFYTQKEILSNTIIKNQLSLNNNKIFIYSYDPSILKLFKKTFPQNLFTFLLNTYLFCFKDLVIDSPEQKITSKITKYFDDEKKNNNIYNNSSYIINSDINFIALNIFSYNYLYYEIINKNIFNYESLVEYFEKLQPKIILIFLRFLTRKQNFVKQRYFISNENIIYKPHYGGLDKMCNGKIDLVLAKSYELKDYEEYKNIFNFLENNYKMVNDIHNFKYFINKNIQNKFLDNFCNIINNNNITHNKDCIYKLDTIKSITLNINEFKNKNNLINTLQKNKINFPIILKYTSDNPKFKHQITIILNENYLDNFINNYINEEINEKYNTTVLLQHITKHGGYVLKIYHMGHKNFIDYRSSLIDIDENNKNLVDELFKEKGFWNFKTIMLESEEYKNNIWNKYVIKDGIENKVKSNKELYDYIINIADLFEIYSHMGLFGIDILIDNENKLYIIDANSLPGYKQGFEVEKDLRNYFQKILEN